MPPRGQQIGERATIAELRAKYEIYVDKHNARQRRLARYSEIMEPPMPFEEWLNQRPEGKENERPISPNIEFV